MAAIVLKMPSDQEDQYSMDDLSEIEEDEDNLALAKGLAALERQTDNLMKKEISSWIIKISM
jgi:hypothetical protein